ncbi:MAG: alpha/beta hydrolase-fold protein [Phycisphaerales bacterium]
MRLIRMIGRIFGVGTLAAFAGAQQPRQNVVFSINQTTTVGQSVFVLGDLPELGNSDMRYAVKLDPSAYPVWRATICLPANRSFTYRYVVRNDGPGQTSQSANGTTVGSVIAASTNAAPLAPTTKTILWTTDFVNPILWWRQDTGAFHQVPMERYGPGRIRTGNIQEQVWFAWKVGAAGKPIEFYLTNAQGGSRSPTFGNFNTELDAMIVQDSKVFSYMPAAAVSVSKRDYFATTPPSMFSANLNETRPYRVYLPRGYAEQPTRRYPVLYMHDGQNIFENGPFGTWNMAPTLESLTNGGKIREAIVVGVDNTANRLKDYLPPGDSISGSGAGWADKYARFLRDELKPYIDSHYRTLTSAGETCTMGSSMGGVVALYLGWDFTNTFGKIGAMSGAWWTTTNFLARVTPAANFRDIRIYMDHGDSGTSNDDYVNSMNLRDALVGGAISRYPLEGTLRHFIGYGQQHNETAWAARLPNALTFLLPPTDEVNGILSEVFNPAYDVNGDGKIDVEDIYAQHGTPKDLNADGLVNGADLQRLTDFVRRNEIEDMTTGRRQ